MDRKTFLEKSLSLMLIALPAYALVGCSSSDDGSSNPDENPNPNAQADCLDNGTNSVIGSNHGHNLTVSRSDVQTGSEKTYSIQGTSGHDHSVTLTANDFGSLQNNQTVSVSSTNNDGHTHTVTVRCA